jgi:predicted nucleotidyltransferase
MVLKRYADRCLDRRELLDEAVRNVITACRAEASVREAFVFGSYATLQIGPTSDLDVLVVRDTDLGIIDRVIDLKIAALSRVNIDMVVVTPYELANTFSTSSFGRTVLAMAKRIYAA